MRISASTARRLALHAQGLDGSWQLSDGIEGAAQVVERLGYVQIDTISVVRRAHHHTEWARHPGYQVGMLNRLVQERRLFEFWSHAMSYLPMSDFPYYRARMGRDSMRGWDRKWHDENRPFIEQVLERVRDEGPLGSADFEKKDGQRSDGWWDWKPAKRALAILADVGDLMVMERRGFARRFDLTERVIPSDILTAPLPAPDEVHRFLARRILTAHGIASQDLVRSHGLPRKRFVSAVNELVDAGDAVEVEVQGIDGHAYYGLTESLENVGDLPAPNGVHILSPFDNALIFRKRLLRLFGFDYTLECYVPAAKRVYGYFSLPVLWGERFIGRLDAKADRKGHTFILRHLSLEESAVGLDLDALWPALAAKVRELATFAECAELSLERVTPESLHAPLARALATSSA